MNKFSTCLIALFWIAMAQAGHALTATRTGPESGKANPEGKVLAYELSIERDPPLALEEWRAAVQAQPRLRYEPVDSRATNPKTGEVITISAREGDVAMELDGRWLNVFRWRNGRVVFRAPMQNPKDPVAMAAFAVAAKLGAIVRGEEGETYSPPD